MKDFCFEYIVLKILYVSATSLFGSLVWFLLIVQFQKSARYICLMSEGLKLAWAKYLLMLVFSLMLIWLVRVFPRLQKSMNRGPGYND